MNKKIKVVIVINDFLVGGAQRMTAHLVAGLESERYEVVLITLFQFDGRDTMYHLLPPGTRLHGLRFRGFSDITSWIRLVRLLRRERPDVVLSHLFFSNTVTRVLQPFLGYTSLAVEHNTYTDKSSWEQLLDRILCRRSYAIIAVSPSVKDFTVAQEGIPTSKIMVIRNGIDIRAIQSACRAHTKQEALSSLGLLPDRRYVVNVGRLVAQKNHTLLLNGFALFTAKQPNYDLLLVGGGGLQALLEKQAEELQIADRVHFFGSRMDVIPFYCASEFFVSTSTIEGFGLTHAEALACGLPLVSTRTAGPDEMIVEGENGFFITKETPEGVAAALEKMIRAEPRSMRGAAERTASRYDIQKTVRAYEELIAEAAGCS